MRKQEMKDFCFPSSCHWFCWGDILNHVTNWMWDDTAVPEGFNNTVWANKSTESSVSHYLPDVCTEASHAPQHWQQVTTLGHLLQNFSRIVWFQCSKPEKMLIFKLFICLLMCQIRQIQHGQSGTRNVNTYQRMLTPFKLIQSKY